MYLHHPTEEDGKYQNLSCEESPVSEAPLFDPASRLNFLKPGQQEVLVLVKIGETVSAGQDASRRRIVQEQLTCNKDGNHTINVSFEVESTCFLESETVHSFSDG